MILLMALSETIGVASILPFIAVITNPDLIETNFVLSKLFQISAFLGVDSVKKFLLLVSIFFIILFYLSFGLAGR